MKLYNSITREKEDFIPIEPGKVRMYACGPTVYNYIHVGNARPIIMFDVLRRYFEYRGLEVTFVQNFTDVDDKIIGRAAEEGISSSELAEKYINEYFHDARALGVRDATVHPKATENIAEIIDLVSTLIDKGFAYEAEGDVYFRTSEFKGYGQLSNQPMDELMPGQNRCNGRKGVSHGLCALEAPSPESPLGIHPGQGRPVGTLSCSPCLAAILGKTIDIHCGGQDLTFRIMRRNCAI